MNIAAEGDPRLTDAAMSTVVTSDVPIIAERSMHWKGAASAFFGLAAEIDGDTRQRVMASPTLATKAGAEARRLAEALRQAHT